MKVEGFLFPDDLRYMKGHVWARENGKEAVLGVTSLGASLAKEIVHVDLPGDGEVFEELSSVASFETIKSVSEVLAPFRCRVLEVNESLLDDPSLINREPYSGGWIVKVEALGDSGSLMPVSEAASYFEKLLSKEKERFAGIYD